MFFWVHKGKQRGGGCFTVLRQQWRKKHGVHTESLTAKKYSFKKIIITCLKKQHFSYQSVYDVEDNSEIVTKIWGLILF